MWIMFSPITTTTQCYYNQPLFWINSLSWIYSVTVIFLIVPALLFLEKFGLKWTGIIGCSLNTAGAWLRFAGSGNDMFWLLFAGQTVASFTYLLLNNGCSKMSALWFSPKERALATTVFVMASSQGGVLIALLVSPLVVTGGYGITEICNITTERTHSNLTIDREEWMDQTYYQFFYYYLAQAILATVIFPMAFLIPEAPSILPSVTSHSVQNDVNIYQALKDSLKNIYFILFTIVIGIFTASGGAFSTVFQEIIHESGYQDDQQYIAYLGVSMMATSIIGSLLIGKWIDCTKSFYYTAVGVCFISTLISLALSLIVQFNLSFILVFVLTTLSSCAFGLLGGISFEYVVEMTYPLPESISAGILSVCGQILAIIMIVVVGLLVQYKMAIFGNYIFCGAMLISSIVMVFIRPSLRRVNIERKNDSNYLINDHDHDN
jgi:FLVCR family feline leukemia virus subgroup C receptor-related protein